MCFQEIFFYLHFWSKVRKSLHTNVTIFNKIISFYTHNRLYIWQVCVQSSRKVVVLRFDHQNFQRTTTILIFCNSCNSEDQLRFLQGPPGKERFRELCICVVKCLYIPFSIRYFTMDLWPNLAAWCNAVMPYWSVASKLTSWFTNKSTIYNTIIKVLMINLS